MYVSLLKTNQKKAILVTELKRLIYIFILLHFAHFARSQDDAEWLAFKIDSAQHSEYTNSRVKGYCWFVNIEQDSNQYTLYEYVVVLNLSDQFLYSKTHIKGHYKYTQDSLAIELMPNHVEIFSRLVAKEIKEVKKPPSSYFWTLYLDPYRLITYDKGLNVYFNSIVLEAISSKQLKEYDQAYKKWSKGQFEYPKASVSYTDTNQYVLEVMTQLEDYDGHREVINYFEKSKKDKENLRIDEEHYRTENDHVDVFTVRTQPHSSHFLVYKHYLILREKGFDVRFLSVN